MKPRSITVLIPTYNRPETVMKTVDLLNTNLVFDGSVRILIGDDGDEKHAVLSFPYHSRSGRWPSNVTVLDSPKRGLGSNLNFLLANAKSDVVLQMDDDHWLVESLDVNQYYDDLVYGHIGIGWIRLFLGEREDYYGNQAGYYKFTAKNVGPYWYLMPRTTELYIPSNRPHLKLKAFHEMYGYYLEDIKLGHTEEAFCHQFEDGFMKQGSDKLWVTIPFFGLAMNQWKHVGNSWQKEGF